MAVNIGMSKKRDGFTVRCSHHGLVTEGASALFAAGMMEDHRAANHSAEDATLYFRFGRVGMDQDELEGLAWAEAVEKDRG